MFHHHLGICPCRGSFGAVLDRRGSFGAVLDRRHERRMVRSRKGFQDASYVSEELESGSHVSVFLRPGLRFGSMHYCYDDPKKQIFFALASTVLETQTRTRLRAHLGTTLR
jgi:hypothetical protein